MKHPAAVVIPSDRPATLGIARSLGRRGIPIYGVDFDPKAYGMASKYLKACPLPGGDDSEENRLRFLVDLGKKLGDKAVLFPLRDDDVLLCSRERKELTKYYTYVMPDHDTVANLLTKDGLGRVAHSCGVPGPQLHFANGSGEVKTIANRLSYPVIIKPVLSTSWLKPEIISIIRESSFGGTPKVALCRDAERLIQTYEKIAAYDSRMVIQEIIPGEDKRLVYFCFYLDRQSKPLASFAGRKLRVFPVGFGSATYVQSFRDPELEDVSLKLLTGTRYQGLGGVEFKKDPRDEKYKIIEFNARFGMWDTLGIRCGVDIPYIAYCDALGLPFKAHHHYREGILWVDSQRDIRAFFIYRNRGQLNLKSWLKSLKGEKDWAIYSRDDWKPALVATARLFGDAWSRVRKKVCFMNSSGARG